MSERAFAYPTYNRQVIDIVQRIQLNDDMDEVWTA